MKAKVLLLSVLFSAQSRADLICMPLSPCQCPTPVISESTGTLSTIERTTGQPTGCGTKICSQCKQNKHIEEFNFSKQTLDKLESKCKDCKLIYYLKNKYNLTDLECVELINKKDLCNCCGNTNKNKRLAVDHCHVTNKVRGFLCSTCNIGIGMLGDNLDGVKKAVIYLEKHEKGDF